jgi:hypothetical protein
MSEGSPKRARRAVSGRTKLILATLAAAMLAAGGAAFAAVELATGSTPTTVTVTTPIGVGLGSYGMSGSLEGRGLGGGLGPGDDFDGPGPGYPPRPFGLGGFAFLGDSIDSMSSYLGISSATLRSDLADGQTLAEVANEQRKSVAGLVSAIVAAARKGLDSAVTAGRMTQAQVGDIASRLPQIVTDIVNGTRPGMRLVPAGSNR